MKKKFFIALVLLYCFNVAFAQSCSKWGPYIGAKFSTHTDADVLMADVMIPKRRQYFLHVHLRRSV